MIVCNLGLSPYLLTLLYTLIHPKPKTSQADRSLLGPLYNIQLGIPILKAQPWLLHIHLQIVPQDGKEYWRCSYTGEEQDQFPIALQESSTYCKEIKVTSLKTSALIFNSIIFDILESRLKW